MTPKPDKIAVISIVIILLLIAIPGGYAYYAMENHQGSFLTAVDRERSFPEFQEDSRVFDNRIMLRKDKAITVNKNRLVFKGIADQKIRLDVYLLELDPDHAYPHYISMSGSEKEFQLGDSRFRVLKLSRGVLQLKLLDRFHS